MRNAGLQSRARIHCLKTETGFTGTRAHAYDANTNRTSDGATSPTLITYTPASNRIATANGITLTHDAAGNLLADGLYTYTWDEAGRLKTVSKNGTLLATYAYDHRNRRRSKSTTAAAPQGAQAILYHYDQDDHLIGETRSDGTPLRAYIWLAERPITIIEHAAISNPPRSLHLQHDHLGTPRLAKNDAGVIQWRWDRDGYGTSMPTQDPDGDGKATVINLRFPGQYYDQESRLYYNWNRYYSPRLGRYLSPDPIGIAGGGNGYGYVEGNPMSYSDPSGLAPTKTVIWLVRICKKGIEKIRPVSYEEAVAMAKKGKDLQSSRDMMKKVGEAASEGRGAIKDPVHPERTTGSTEGRKPHYHVTPRNGGHLFYSIVAAATVAGHVDCEDCVMAYIAEGIDFFNPLSLPKDLIDLTGTGGSD